MFPATHDGSTASFPSLFISYWDAWLMESSLPCRYAVPPGPWSGPSWTGLSLLMWNGELHSLSINSCLLAWGQLLSREMIHKSSASSLRKGWMARITQQLFQTEEETSHPKTKVYIQQRKNCDSNASEISINTRDWPVKFFREDPVAWQCLF